MRKPPLRYVVPRPVRYTLKDLGCFTIVVAVVIWIIGLNSEFTHSIRPKYREYCNYFSCDYLVYGSRYYRNYIWWVWLLMPAWIPAIIIAIKSVVKQDKQP